MKLFIAGQSKREKIHPDRMTLLERCPNSTVAARDIHFYLNLVFFFLAMLAHYSALPMSYVIFVFIFWRDR